MIESFAQLFEESLNSVETRQGSIVKGTVVAIENGFVLVDAGLKSESAIPAEEFKNALGELEISVGDTVDVALDSIEDGFGETKLSREKAKRAECWIVLEAAFSAEEVVKGVINGKVHVHDLNATILNQLGFDHERFTYRFQGRDFRLTDVHGEVVRELLL